MKALGRATQKPRAARMRPGLLFPPAAALYLSAAAVVACAVAGEIGLSLAALAVLSGVVSMWSP